MSDTRLLNCPECDSGDVVFESISVRPYCNECKYWAPINYTGTKQDAIDAWNKKKLEVEETIDKLFVDADSALSDDAQEITAEAEGISSISMGENVGWITGPHDAVKAVQKLIIDGEDYRKDIHNMGEGLKALSIEYAKLVEENKALESKREYDIEAMRTAQGLLKDGGQGSIVDTVWCNGEGNMTLWELLAMAID